MSRVSEELGASEGAQPLLQLDLAHYTLQPVRADAEFELFRGRHSGPGDASPPTILVLVQVKVFYCPATNPSAAVSEVLELLAAGNSNKLIATALTISEETAKTHVRNIIAKLGARDRTHAVTLSLRRGIIQL
jgi:DNA-binding CsgD family transcriptional regulator